MKTNKTRKTHTDLEIKKQACRDVDDNKMTQKQVAEKYGVTLRTISNWLKWYRTGNLNKPKRVHSKNQLDTALIFPNDQDVLAVENAAALLGITIDELLKYAVCNRIELFYPVYHHDLTVSSGELGRPYAFSKTHPELLSLQKKWGLNRLDYLSLDASDIAQILRQGVVRKTEFAYGIYFGLNEEVARSQPTSRFGEKSTFVIVNGDYVLRKWSIDPKEDFQECYIEGGDVFALKDGLIRLWSEEVKSVSTRPPLEDDFVQHFNSSTFLVDIDQAAFEVFSGNNPIRKVFFSGQGKVSIYLQEEYGFNKTKADQSSEIITPSDNNEILSGSYRTKRLQGLIDAWSDLCANYVDDVSKESHEINYLKWLSSRPQSLSESLRVFACKVIAPDNAKFPK